MLTGAASFPSRYSQITEIVALQVINIQNPRGEVAASGAPTIQEKPDKAKQLKMRHLFTEDACSATLIWEYYEMDSAEMVFRWENLPRSAEEARFHRTMLSPVLPNDVKPFYRTMVICRRAAIRSLSGGCVLNMPEKIWPGLSGLTMYSEEFAGETSMGMRLL